MDDLGGLISSFLGNPENVEKLKTVLDSFGKDSPQPDTAKEQVPVSAEDTEPDFKDSNTTKDDGNKTISAQALKTALKKLPISEDNERSRLLKALKPYLSPKRAEYIDTAVGLLSISKIISSVYDKK